MDLFIGSDYSSALHMTQFE